MFLSAMALAAVVSTNTPDLVYMNTKYAITQAERGLVCYGCAEEPVNVKGTDTIKYSDSVLVESGSAGIVFVSTNVSDSCPAGNQYIINLEEPKAYKLSVPCQATSLKWEFSESGVKYSYVFEGLEHELLWDLKY